MERVPQAIYYPKKSFTHTVPIEFPPKFVPGSALERIIGSAKVGTKIKMKSERTGTINVSWKGNTPSKDYIQ
jgi:hypothetical protein